MWEIYFAVCQNQVELQSVTQGGGALIMNVTLHLHST